MMRGVLLLGLTLTIFLAGVGFAEDWGCVKYETSNLGGDRWQYTYEVRNISLSEPIEEFTIWFGYGLYADLLIETAEPLASNWDEIVWQPEPFLGDDGGYDALATGLNIGVGESVTGFAVSFDWSGTGAPGSQYYEIINPVNFSTIESGWTTPEPGVILLLGLGSVLVRRKAALQRRQ